MPSFEQISNMMDEFCGVWSGSPLFASYPFRGLQATNRLKQHFVKIVPIGAISNTTLILTTAWTFSADEKFMDTFCFYFPQKIDFHFSCKLLLREQFAWNVKPCILVKNQVYISKCRLLILFTHHAKLWTDNGRYVIHDGRVNSVTISKHYWVNGNKFQEFISFDLALLYPYMQRGKISLVMCSRGIDYYRGDNSVSILQGQ